MQPARKRSGEWRKIFTFSSKYVRGQRVKLASILIVIVIGSIVSSITPYIWGEIIDEVTLGHINQLFCFLCLYFLIAFFTLGMSFLEGYLGTKLNYDVEAEIKQRYDLPVPGAPRKIKFFDSINIEEKGFLYPLNCWTSSS